MANFKTHLVTATIAGGGLSSMCLGAELVAPRELLGLWAAAILGGILPDIDSDHSAAIDVIFTLFAMASAFLLILTQADGFAVAELWLIWGGGYLLIRYPVMGLFRLFTVHRGIYHSVLAGVMFWFVATAFCSRICGQGAFLAWLTGCFVFLGYIVHLALDELYAVDFVNAKLKRSWGSAFKLVSFQHPSNTLLMGMATLLMFFLCPSPEPFTQAALNPATYARVRANLLPITPQWVENFRSALHTIEVQKQDSENL